MNSTTTSSSIFSISEMVEDELHDHIVLHLEHLRDPLGDPWLQNVQLDLRHVHLLPEYFLELHLFHQLFLFIGEPIILVGTRSPKIASVRHCSSHHAFQLKKA